MRRQAVIASAVSGAIAVALVGGLVVLRAGGVEPVDDPVDDDEPFVLQPPVGGDDGMVALTTDVVGAARAAEGLVGGIATETDVDTLGYLVEVQLGADEFVVVSLDSAFGLVFQEPIDPPTPDDQLASVDLEGAAAAGLAEAGEGTVVGVEVQDGGYDVDVQRTDGTTLEVILSVTFEVISTRIRT